MMVDGIMKKLPEDVVIYILLKFTVKSLIRFKCISRTWYTLVQSSTFINLHLNRPTTRKNEFILFSRSIKVEPHGLKNVISIIYSDNDDDLNSIFPDLDPPYLTFSYYYAYNELVGPCNGLLVLTDFEVIILLNPATRNYMPLPSSPFVCAEGLNLSIMGGVGFGFDWIGNDYKVIRILEVFKDADWSPDVIDQKVEVYDLHTDSWREFRVGQQFPKVHWLPHFEIFHKGAFHWYANIDDAMVILCFDMSTEIFRTMIMPDSFNDYDGKYYSLVILNESLTLICYPDSYAEIDLTQDSMDVWIMMDYGVRDSWTKKYMIRPPPFKSPLTIWKNHLLFLQNKGGLLISYDLISNEAKEFNLQGYPQSLRIIVYKESLISIPKRVRRSSSS
ncbi:F-box/kelch-repeat protein At3g06240-like [Nicotiana tabacum]|uniref:F-box/kelch-repeat protein At3g06240-like n=1 Tax=Nicotiana tabacum TaxID=4097 RepID=A0A1S3YZ74_TOBAC|nr:PREDICTED: F-box/kelch-repeat protein At3g06240-like [Nicotiana tabacum]